MCVCAHTLILAQGLDTLRTSLSKRRLGVLHSSGYKQSYSKIPSSHQWYDIVYIVTEQDTA